MKKCMLLPVLFIGFLSAAQNHLSIVKATSKKVAIKDGDFLDKNAWSLSPATRPDVYTAERTRKTKWVVFYTDIDSIRIKIKPGTSYDFIVVLNGKDSCYTRIESAIPREDKVRNKVALQDTIPFTLTSYDAISCKAVVNDADTLTLHFDTGSSDVRITKDAITRKTRLLSGQPSGAAADFNKLNRVLKLQIGNLILINPPFGTTTLTAHDMDGRFGWNLFEGKQVELDYDKNLLIIHSGKLMKAPKGYTKSQLAFAHSFMIVKGMMRKNGQGFPADFIMDSGSEQALIFDSTWAAAAGFANGIPLIRSIILHDPRGNTFETKVVLAPELQMNGTVLTDVPSLILSSHNPAGFPVNTIGNDVLKRFNIVMDFKNDVIYWKPNALINMKYRERS